MTLNVGFIGVGGIANVHLNNIAKIDGAKVAAVSDINAQQADAVGRKYSATAYTNHYDMLEREKLDAVYICIPPFAHGDVELAVVKRGIPMFVEKPLAVRRNPADAILRAVTEQKLITAVGYQWRYSEASNLAKTALADRRPGMALGCWFGGMPMVGWWRKMERSGGQMVEQTTHIVDLARYLLGEVTEVYAVYAQREMLKMVEGTTVPDVGSVTLRFANGAIGTISNTCLLDQGYTVGLDVLTRDTVFEIRGDSLTERRNGETVTRRNKTNPYTEEDVAFLEAVKSGDPKTIRSTYEDAYKTHLVTVAANESAESGKPVNLDQVPAK